MKSLVGHNILQYYCTRSTTCIKTCPTIPCLKHTLAWLQALFQSLQQIIHKSPVQSSMMNSQGRERRILPTAPAVPPIPRRLLQMCKHHNAAHASEGKCPSWVCFLGYISLSVCCCILGTALKTDTTVIRAALFTPVLDKHVHMISSAVTQWWLYL